MGCIYKIANTVNGKAYIGQTSRDIEKRVIHEHFNGHTGSRLLSNAIKKYGVDSFSYEILYEGIIPELLDSFEIQAIELHNTLTPHGYNLAFGGRGGKHSPETRRKMSESLKGHKNPNFGKKHSVETRRKISEALKGKPLSLQTREKMSKLRKGKPGKPQSPETKRKISEALKGEKHYWYGRKHTSETLQKMSEAKKGKKRSQETCQKLSYVQQSPERKAMRPLYFSLPSHWTVKQKRQWILNQVPHISKQLVRKWVRKWESETNP